MTSVTTNAPPKLTPKQERFVEEFCIDWNATQAAVRAGYSAKTAGTIGARLTKNVQIARLVKEKRAELAARASQAIDELVLTPARVLREVARIGLGDIRRLYREDGSLKAPHELDDDTAAMLAGVETVEEFERDADGKRESVGFTKKVKLWDKNTALEKAMRHLGLYAKENEQLGAAAAQFAELRGLVARGVGSVTSVAEAPNAHSHQ